MEKRKKEADLISKVTELFMRFGVKSQTMDDIAKHLGISKKTLYAFVKDKKQLVNKVVERMILEEQLFVGAAIKQSETAVDELIEITKCMSSKLGDVHPSVIFDLQKYHRDAWQIIEKHKSEFIHGIMLANLKRGVKQGYYRKNLNPEVITDIYLTMVDSTMNAENPMSKKMPIEKLHLEVINYHLSGISNEKGMIYLKEALKKEQGNKLSFD